MTRVWDGKGFVSESVWNERQDKIRAANAKAWAEMEEEDLRREAEELAATVLEISGKIRIVGKQAASCIDHLIDVGYGNHVSLRSYEEFVGEAIYWYMREVGCDLKLV